MYESINKPTMMLPKEIAEEFGIPIYRVRKWVKEGKIVYVACGKKALINRDKFLAFLNGELEAESKTKSYDMEH